MGLTMDRWRGKIAIVTGASSGIGAAIAAKLVEEGLQVVALARRMEKLAKLQKELQGKAGKLHPICADVTIEGDILRAFKWTKDNLGTVQVLVNNAGVLKNKTLCESTVEDWRTVFDTNVIGLCVATKEAVAVMKSSKVEGHIIHINSISGHYILKEFTHFNVYPASKHAVTALSKILRHDINSTGSNIRVTNLSPGAVDTDMLDKDFVKTIPLLKGEDIAEGVVFALSTPPRVTISELTIQATGEAF